jgi:hypothetical protein
MDGPDGRARIWYVVAPHAGRWQVTFGHDNSPFQYATREEALVIACSAAQLHWEDRGQPAGARLDLPGEPRHVVATFGRVPHLARRRTA